jgi:Tol biopolymer transport system component
LALATINADGTNETPLTSAEDSAPAWSPDGTKIAFRHSASPAGIYTMDANGGNQVNIIPNSTEPFPAASISYHDPAWQPVAQVPNTFVISGRLTHNGLPVIGATVNLSGTTNAATTTDTLGNFQFSALPQNGSYAVAPSFRRHYFTPANRSVNNLTSNQSANFEVLTVCHFGNCTKNGKIGFARASDIFVINPDGTGETNITNHAAVETIPSFAPDGSVIFQSGRDGNFEIYRKSTLDDPNPVNLTNNAAADIDASYSFDGKSIVFASFRDGNSEIYRMNADGSNPVRLTNSPGIDEWPALSPDGQKIIYANLPDGGNPDSARIFVMNADGSDPHQLSNLGGIVPSFERLSYSPDGSKIIFTYSPDRQSNVPGTWTMNSDGTNATGGSGAPGEVIRPTD